MQLLKSKWGENHGLINVLPNSVKANDFKGFSPEEKKKCEAMKAADEKIVKARYINHRGKSERLTKPYMRWAGEPIRIFHLIPGEVYDLPMGMINEVNDPKKRLPIRSEILDARGVPTLTDQISDPLHELVPVSF